MYPLKLKAVMKDAIWGGYALSEQYHLGEEGQKNAEAWVLTCREDGMNVIENGVYAGKRLDEVLPECEIAACFPLLIKLIDAHDRLSVQVHPDDAYAISQGMPMGKTEMWYILDAAPGARIQYGLKKDLPFSEQAFREAAANGTLEKYLHYVDAHKGDVFYIPSGMVHAIGAGILLAEVQQNSNTTYRLYDYDRTDKNGNKRELHIDHGVRVIKSDLPNECGRPEKLESGKGYAVKKICHSPYFKADAYEMTGAALEVRNETTSFLLCTEGDGCFRFEGIDYPFKKGDGYLFPASIDTFSIVSSGAELLRARYR